MSDPIIRAFKAGQSASRQELPRSINPHRPSEEELYQAWNCGFDEEDDFAVVTIRET